MYRPIKKLLYIHISSLDLHFGNLILLFNLQLLFLLGTSLHVPDIQKLTQRMGNSCSIMDLVAQGSTADHGAFEQHP